MREIGVALWVIWSWDMIDAGEVRMGVGDVGGVSVMREGMGTRGQTERLSAHPTGFPATFPPLWAEAWGDDRYGLWAELQIKDVTQRMRWIAPGSFMMGSPDDETGHQKDESPQHRITLTEGLWLADTACTQALWIAVMGNNPSYVQDNPDKPVEQVSWDDVQVFCNSLHEQGSLPVGIAAGLPTEAEWEYACRAGTTTAYSFGDSLNREQANIDHDGDWNERLKAKQTTIPVKALPANPWGLYQMHGNVWEWCDDWRDYAKKSADPRGAREGDSYAVRGGAWISGAQLARSALRFQGQRDRRYLYLGFRFALRSTSPAGAGGPVL